MKHFWGLVQLSLAGPCLLRNAQMCAEFGMSWLKRPQPSLEWFCSSLPSLLHSSCCPLSLHWHWTSFFSGEHHSALLMVLGARPVVAPRRLPVVLLIGTGMSSGQFQVGGSSRLVPPPGWQSITGPLSPLALPLSPPIKTLPFGHSPFFFNYSIS